MGNTISKKSKAFSYEYELFELLTGRKFIKPERGYNWTGLRFSPEYFKNQEWAITVFPLETIAEFIPQYTKQCVDFDNRFVMKNLIERAKSTDYKMWKCEDIGALAYMGLKCKNEETKESALEVYDSFNIYCVNRIFRIFEAIDKEANLPFEILE